MNKLISLYYGLKERKHNINRMNILNLPSEILQQLFCSRPVINKELQQIFNDNIPFVYNEFIKGSNDIILYSIKSNDETDMKMILNKYYKKDHWINQCYFGFRDTHIKKTVLYKQHNEKIDVITKSICVYIHNDFLKNYKNIYDKWCNGELSFYMMQCIRKYYNENRNRFSKLNQNEFFCYFSDFIKINVFKIEQMMNKDENESDVSDDDYEDDVSDDDYEDPKIEEVNIKKDFYVYDYKLYMNEIVKFRNNITTTNKQEIFKKRIVVKKITTNNVYCKSNTEIKNILEKC